VTTNYRVRARGWKKMGGPDVLASALPGLVRFGGSDMTRYRAASKAWYQVFQSFSPGGIVVMKKSIDESYIDLTAECMQRIKEGRIFRAAKQSAEEKERIDAQAAQRFAKAEAAWKAADALMLSRGVSPADLESTGSLRSAQFFSRSTDPISELRRRAEKEALQNADRLPTAPDDDDTSQAGVGGAAAAGVGGGGSGGGGGGANAKVSVLPNGTNAQAPNAAELAHLTVQQVEELCNRIHPLDHCRADKRLPPLMLQPLAAPVAPEQRLSGVENAPWREMFVGYVFLDGTDSKAVTPAAAAAAGEAREATDAEADTGVVVPPSTFAHEDPLNPSHDLLLAVGSQVVFEMRCRLFELLGFTTSAGVAPNCMLAKLASSLNKPNQQSVVRASVAQSFLAPLKLKAVSGFGPKAEEQAEEKGLVTVGDVQRLSPQALARMFPGSDKFAAYLADIAAGVDDTPVLVHAAPKSIGQSKRQRTFNTAQRLSLLDWLCSKLMERVFDDEREYSRRATGFTFSWITTNDWTSISRRAPLPPHKGERRSDGLPVHHEMLELASRMCRTYLPDTLALRCLAVSVSNFVPLQGGKRLEAFFGAATTAANNNNNNSAAASTSSSTAPSTATASQSLKDRASTSSPSIAAFFSLPPSAPSSATPPASAPVPAPTPSPSLAPLAAAQVPAVSSAAVMNGEEDEDMMPLLEHAPPAPASVALHLLDNMAGVVRARREQRDREERAMDAADAAAAGVVAVPAPTAEADAELSQQEKDEIEALFGGSQPTFVAVDAPTFASEDSGAATAAAASASEQQQPHVCSECGQTVQAGAAWVEHTDRHFAARFQAELREQDRRLREKEQQAAATAAAATAAAANGTQRSGGKRKMKSSAASSPAAAGNMSLTRFLVAQQPSSEGSSGAAAIGGGGGAHVAPSKRVHATAPVTHAPAANANQSLKRFFSQPPPPAPPAPPSS
jgi:nucleotidyltransferase/DNA polymerase involved in DNA repair